MRSGRTKRMRRTATQRRGEAALEEVMILTVVIPLTALATFASIKMLVAIFDVIASIVGWPYM